MSVHPLLGIVLMLTLLAALVGALRIYQLRCNPHPELVRKLLHVLMGASVLTFPWLFAEPWPVAVLAIAAMGGLYAMRRVEALKQAVGGVVHGVARESRGELYFPLAVCVLFYFSHHDPILYAVPILILTLADATAALIGTRYGSLHYTTPDGIKSVEGSAAFFLVAFLSVHVPLLLFTDTGRVETLVIGVILGVFIMLVEAMAWRGLDNLFVPLFGYLLLRRYVQEDVAMLLSRLAAIVLLSLLVLAWRKRTTLDSSGLIAAALVFYVTWSLGGWTWMLAPMTGLLTYTLLWPRTEDNSAPFHDARVVLGITAAGLFWVFIAERYAHGEWLYFSTLGYAAQLAMIGAVQSRYAFSRGSSRRHPVYSSLIAWTVMFGPFILVGGRRLQDLLLAGAALPLIALAVVVFIPFWRRYRDDALASKRWLSQAVIGSTMTFVAIVPWLWLTSSHA